MGPRVAVVGAATLATALWACASISGLTSFSAGDCATDSCDASVHPAPGDGTSEAVVMSGPGAGSEEPEAGPGEDGEADGMPPEAGTGPETGASAGTDAGVPCPDGGCPMSTATGFSCPFGHCNGTSGECATPGGCFCSNDNQCLSEKCVKVTGENDVSCGSNCSGSGGRDGFDCELVSPGIPELVGATYACPAGSGFGGTTLSCDPTHTNCYCIENAQCPSGQCVPSANNGNCSGCTGTGTPDYRGCAPPVALATQCNGIGYSMSCTVGTCTVDNFDPIVLGVCLCNDDKQCESGKCVPNGTGVGENGTACGSNCTGSGAADEHQCQTAPSSVPCMGTGGTSCSTTLTPAPVLVSGGSACLCVADSDCSSGTCVNANSQCTGTCTATAPHDSQDCETVTSVANGWSCSIGNCDEVTAPSGRCTAAGVPCWCTSDAQCPGETHCVSWAGCAEGACTGTGTGNAFHCVP